MSNSIEIFKIENKQDILKMQKILLKKKEETEKQYIALELAENMIDAGEHGEICINGVQVINKVYKKTKIVEVKEIINKAKFFKQNNLTGKINYDKKNPENNLGGRGILSILHSGWDIEINEEANGFSITATRPTAALSV